MSDNFDNFNIEIRVVRILCYMYKFRDFPFIPVSCSFVAIFGSYLRLIQWSTLREIMELPTDSTAFGGKKMNKFPNCLVFELSFLRNTCWNFVNFVLGEKRGRDSLHSDIVGLHFLGDIGKRCSLRSVKERITSAP